MSLKKAYLIVIAVLLVDQISKIYIKTHFRLRESKEVFSWFYIQFIENDGMAWGAELPGWAGGKLTLTLFRILAVVGIGWWLKESIKKRESNYLIVSIALILAGAFGNIIDSVSYGLIFDHSLPQKVASFNTANHYGTLLHGKVVDMLYFPIIDTVWPRWVPVLGGRPFSFFNAIFNVADAAISVAVGILIIFNKKAFPKHS